MRPIHFDCPLAVGDVLHQAAFGFAVVTGVDVQGAQLRWETAGALHPPQVTRAALHDAYRLTHPDGVLRLTVLDADHARRLMAADPAAVIGRLLLDVAPAETSELGEWLAARRLVPRPEFAIWWPSVEAALRADPRFGFDGVRWTVTAGARFPDPTLRAPEPLPAPGSWDAALALDYACALAAATAALHARGLTLDGERAAFEVHADGIVARGRAGGSATADVRTVARIVLEQLLGPMVTAVPVPPAELLHCVEALLPAAPFELVGVLTAALAPAPLRLPDGLALLHAFESARATAGLRARFPHAPHARVALGFDTHIGAGRALSAKVNQDSVGVAGDPDCALMAVADGISLCTVGSGDRASRLLTDTLQRGWSGMPERLRGASPARVHLAIADVLTRANRAIVAEATQLAGGSLEDAQPMGTTAVVAVTCGNRVHLASLGDSRAWLVTPAAAHLLTADQNRQASLVRDLHAGLEVDGWTERYALTGYCGHTDEDGRAALPPVFARTFTLLPGEWVILATDGLADYAHPEDAGVAAILRGAVADARGATDSLRAMDVARRLVQAANAGGGGDNVTVLAFTLSADPGSAANDAPHGPG